MDNDKTIRNISVCGGMVTLPYREVISMNVGGIALFAPKSHKLSGTKIGYGKDIKAYVDDEVFYSMSDDEFRNYVATLF